MPARCIDLRSDTVTRPTPAMRKAMAEAVVGDDVLGEDPTIAALEALGAEMTGKEASLYVPSGTFGNQCALFTHCRRGSEVILPEQSHIVQHEAGAASIIAGVQLRTFEPAGGSAVPRWRDFELRLRIGGDIHYPPTALVEYENATSGGDVVEPAAMAEIADGARRAGVPVHLDGARIFNAAAALGVKAADLARHVDSVMFCLSKGLCAPVGSLLAGSRDFVEQARRRRKIMGGGMRQAGVIAAAGIVALREMTPRVAEDHEKARVLAAAFSSTGLADVLPDPPRINMLFVRIRGDLPHEAGVRLVTALRAEGVLAYEPEGDWTRFVAHHDVSLDAIRAACDIIPRVVERVARAPTVAAGAVRRESGRA